MIMMIIMIMILLMNITFMIIIITQLMIISLMLIPSAIHNISTEIGHMLSMASQKCQGLGLQGVYTLSPLEDSRLFGPSPWKVLATTHEKKDF